MAVLQMASRGREGFMAHYQELLGERWPQLMRALTASERKFELATHGDAAYELDPASVWVARMGVTGIAPERVLDLCSSPGGKALVLLFSLSESTQFVLNDLSADRVGRLRRVLDQHVSEAARARLKVFNHDGSRWGLHEQNLYDLVVVDAPCSGERHLLESEKDMAVWSAARSSGLAHRQHALLCAALEAAKPGARILYSTCALATNENDGVIQYFLKKRDGRVVVETVELSGDDLGLRPERTEFGWRILPDTSGGAGPMYACVLKKLG